MELLRDRGYAVAKVEYWDAFARKRRDLFGLFDILYAGDGEIGAVQTTTASNVASRIQKITNAEVLPQLRKAGLRMWAHGWRKNTSGKWVCREVDLS